MMLGNGLVLLKEAYAKWRDDKGPRLGAALAYYAIFSIPPLMMIALALFSLVYSDNISNHLETQIAVLIGDETATTLLSGVQMMTQKGGAVASLVGLAVLFFGASGVFAELQDALNLIWGIQTKDRGLKGLLRGRFTSFTMVLGICFLLLVSLIISAAVATTNEQLGAWLPERIKVFSSLLDASASTPRRSKGTFKEEVIEIPII